jgi:hypothetical protein
VTLAARLQKIMNRVDSRLPDGLSPPERQAIEACLVVLRGLPPRLLPRPEGAVVRFLDVLTEGVAPYVPVTVRAGDVREVLDLLRDARSHEGPA